MCTHVDKNLINKLQGVAGEHDGDNSPIDLSPQGVAVNLLSLAIQIGVLMEVLEGGIDIFVIDCGRGRLWGIQGHFQHLLLIGVGI